jgi:hypothetical protein
MAIVLELLSPKNIPIKHYKFDQDYVCVGRDFNNDLRLDDPYVCPSHMLVAIDPESGQLMVNDCQSTNGIKVNNKIVRQANLTSHDIIKIGRTRFRVIDTKVPLVEAMPLSELEENISWLNKAHLALILCLLCLSFLMISRYLTSVTEFNLVKALPSELGQLAILFLWPLSFAVLAKVVKKESYIVSQFSLTLLLILTINVLLLIEKVLVFNLQPDPWFSWLELTILAGLSSGFIWLSLFIAFHQSNKRRNIIAFTMTFIILAPISALGFLNNGEFTPRPRYNPVLLPPAYNFTRAIETEKFVNATDKLFSQVDKLKSQ